MENAAVAKAPGVVKLFGEHAVVYGKLAVAMAVGLYSTATVSDSEGGSLEIELADLNGSSGNGNFRNMLYRCESCATQQKGKTAAFSKGMLLSLWDSYSTSKDIGEFAHRSESIDPDILPYAVIAARLSKEHDLPLCSMHVKIRSDIPFQKGLASSAACSTAFTVAVLKAAGARLPDDETIDVAREGERIVHRNMNAGAIDTSTAYFGGVVSYSAAGGARHEEGIAPGFSMLLVDTGPKRSTAEMVGSVRSFCESNAEEGAEILDKIEKCSMGGLEALRKNDVARLGALMYENHELLKRLHVSSNGLDTAVRMARENGASGAKLSGGGGGGIMIVVCGNDGNRLGSIASAMEQYGFGVLGTAAATDGGRDYLPKDRLKSF